MTEVHYHYHYYCQHKSCRPKEETKQTGLRSFNSTELHVISMLAAMPHVSAIAKQKLIMDCAEALPAPEPGDRDNRMARVAEAIDSLCKGVNPPIREVGEFIQILIP